MRRASLVVVFGVMLVAANGAAGADAAAQPLFTDSAPFEVTLEGPFRTLSRERENEPELPALLRYVESDGREVVLDVQIKPRGNSRLRHCAFPPLRLDFTRSPVVGTVFEGQDRLKLVTHCMRTSSYRNYVAREYQAYRAYNLLTDRSFRVRRLSIQYVDTESRRKPYTEPGFFIEEHWAVAARLGMETLDVESLVVEELDRSETALMALFQFMIGNMDWSALKGPPGELCCHNGKLISPIGQIAARVFLPYDFDQADFIDAEYAVHNESLGLRRNERQYKGYCAMNSELERAITSIVDVKEDWLNMLDAEPLSKSARRRGIRYVETGYEIIADPKHVERNIIADCRQ